MNVRFFAGTKAQYLALPAPRNPLGLYFCEDTKELFWADRLLTDGIRIIPTYADLPAPKAAADGTVYYVTETRNGYTVSPDRSAWLQTIYAPATSAYDVPESEIYNTVTTVGAVRDIEEKIYDTIDERVAELEVLISSAGVKTIVFAGVEFTEVDGAYTIDRACARRALGLKVPEGMEEEEIEFATTDFVEQKIAEAELGSLATKEALAEALQAAKDYADTKDTAVISYVDSEINRVEEAISNLNHFKAEIVDGLDKVTETGVLYLIKDESVKGTDKYNEYIVIDDEPVLIGDTATDLSNYYDKAAIDEMAEDVQEALDQLSEQLDTVSFKQSELESNTVTKAEFETYQTAVTTAINNAKTEAIEYTDNRLTTVNTAIENIENNIENNYVTINTLEEKQYITESEAATMVETTVQEVIKKELETTDSIAYGDFDV